MAQILLVEDHHATREFLADSLRALGNEVVAAEDGSAALRLLGRRSVDVVLSDFRMAPMDGVALLRAVRQMLDIPFILYSAGASTDAVFDAGRYGAVAFLEFPFRIDDQLVPCIDASVAARRRPETPVRRGADRVLGTSPAAQRVRSFIRRLAPTPATVLITGETGTGKELVARALHEESGRSKLVTVSVTELAEGVLDSELFGHERGAFTGAVSSRVGLFEEADGGTLFLDEIGDAPLPVQAKLLRALEHRRVRPVGGTRTRSVDARVVLATHQPLGQRVAEGRFRQDLLFRINQTRIHLLPLRERSEDIEPIATAQLEQLSQEAGLPVPSLTPRFLEALRRAPWRGNVREMRGVLQNMVLWWDGISELDETDLLATLASLDPALPPEGQALCQQMVDAYRRANRNQEAARRELGMSRGEWRHRWERFGLDVVRRRRQRPAPAAHPPQS